MKPVFYIILIALNSCLSKTEIKEVPNEKPVIENKLLGTWVLDSTNLSLSLLARIPSFCNDLYPSSRFIFTSDSTLKVVAKDSTKECFEYSYSLQGNQLTLIEWDMLMIFEIKNVTKNLLIIRSPYMPDKSFNQGEGYLLYLSKEESK